MLSLWLCNLTSPRCLFASGGASHSLALEAAVQSAREGGHLFIAAAGNMGSSTLDKQHLKLCLEQLMFCMFCFVPGVLCRQIWRNDCSHCGCEGNDFVPTFPCNYEAALCVAATTVTDELADYSNYGVNSVQIAAPGRVQMIVI